MITAHSALNPWDGLNEAAEGFILVNVILVTFFANGFLPIALSGLLWAVTGIAVAGRLAIAYRNNYVNAERINSASDVVLRSPETDAQIDDESRCARSALLKPFPLKDISFIMSCDSVNQSAFIAMEREIHFGSRELGKASKSRYPYRNLKFSTRGGVGGAERR